MRMSDCSSDVCSSDLTSQSLGDGPMTSIAPSINFVTREGKTLSLASLKGRWVLINFWASWCAPCIDELPNLVRAQDEYSGLGLQIIEIGRASCRERVCQYV